MSAVRFSLSSSINRSFLAIRVSIFAVSRSRNWAICSCSGRGGAGSSTSEIDDFDIPNLVTPFASTQNCSLNRVEDIEGL
jgi:hypothetical protein